MNKFTVRGVDGAVDVAASVSAYAAALTDWVSRNETPVSEIEAAVNAVFDKEGSRIPTPALVSMATHRITNNPDTFNGVSKRVHAWLKSQTAQGSKFVVVHGLGGGVVRTTAE